MYKPKNYFISYDFTSIILIFYNKYRKELIYEIRT